MDLASRMQRLGTGSAFEVLARARALDHANSVENIERALDAIAATLPEISRG